MFPNERGDSRATGTFWEHWADEADAAPEFVEGFTDGALEEMEKRPH